MRKLPLGNSGVDVSALCLGAMYLGSREDKATSYDLLDQYSQAGGSFIDTANIYVRWREGFVGGESETLLGQWMKDRGNRDELFIASKLGFEYQDVERGLGAAQIADECEKSLKRLGVDTIDLYYSHVDDRNTPLEETMEAYDKLVKAGKVRFIGASNFLAWRMAEVRSVCAAHNRVDYCCIQQRYTYARPRSGTTFAPQISANDDLLDYVKSSGITLLAYSPL
ncbi:MAG: aldo/keto reductase, partial [Planctomycetota bacterium]